MNRDTLEIVERIIIENTRSDVERFASFLVDNWVFDVIGKLIISEMFDVLKVVATMKDEKMFRRTSYYTSHYWTGNNVPLIKYLYEYTDEPWTVFDALSSINNFM